MRIRRLEAETIRTLVLAGLALVAALATLPAHAASDHTVAVFSNGYRDAATGTPVTAVPVGATVTWVWESGFHSVTRGLHAAIPALDGFDSDRRDAADAQPFSVTFNAPGEHVYYCTLHAGMRGVVRVG